MPVKVTKSNQSNTVTPYAEGEEIDIRDGHLVVTSQNSRKPLAIYAPGKWVWAEVTK